ncbi:MAG: hypothetical protein GW886_15230 [Rhodobacterales bacterium]|nr:hypothetical protein [Rhodobacterales bacterium]
MARLILMGLFIAAILITVTSVMALFETRGGPVAAQKKDTTMPATVRKFAYVLLIIVMFGVTTGWLVASV